MAPETVVKTSLDFPWKSQIHPDLGRLAVEHCKANVVDVGCGTCQMYRHLRANGWNGQYTGIDVVAYQASSYPEGAKVVVGDALTMDLPAGDTFILHDVLEHVDDPVSLLGRCLRSAKNALIAVPKRNEDLWKSSLVEYHHLDKTHKHWGFTEEEARRLVERAGGRIAHYHELAITDLVAAARAFVQQDWFLRVIQNFVRVFPTKSYAQEIWCEVLPAG
jgi:SAM-dependent methyltransferase